jgi:hypothetical protein
MLTHRAEGSGLEAKTALRGSVLRAISQIYVLFLEVHPADCRCKLCLGNQHGPLFSGGSIAVPAVSGPFLNAALIIP